MATGPSEDLLWDYKPTPKWRTPDDPFFTEGNRVCQVTSKQIMTDMDEEVDAKSRYEMHYNNAHKNACSECHRSFPTSHLLEIHVLEWHDNMFQLLASKKNMYQCLVESCTEVFPDAKARKDHLVKTHRYPANFRFDVVPPKNDRAKQKKKEARQKKTLAEKQLEMDTSHSCDTSMDPIQSSQSKIQSNKDPLGFDMEMEMESSAVEEAARVSDEIPADTQPCSAESKQSTTSQSGRKFIYNVPKSFSFGQGVSRGFHRGRGRGRGGRKRHWYQRQSPEVYTTTNIEDVQFTELMDALDDAS